MPKELPLSADAVTFVDEMAGSIFPLAPRAAGATFDALVSNPGVNDCPLEDIAPPTLLVHAHDDPLTSHDAAQRAAERIPGARLVSVASGGHLLLGQSDRVRSEIAAFLAEPVTASGTAQSGYAI